MNINRTKYPVLRVLDKDAQIAVPDYPQMVAWLKDTVDPEGKADTHIKYLQDVIATTRSAMRENVMMVSDPMLEMAAKNFKQMHKLLIEDWIDNTLGSILMKDGTMYSYITFRTPVIDEYAYEECKGCAIIIEYDKRGFMSDCALISSRVEYEGDGTRKLMYDCPFNTFRTDFKFAPILGILAFLQYADVETVEVDNRTKRKAFEQVVENYGGYPIKFIDSKWLREIIRTEGFKVSGHFRLIKKGKNGTINPRLIYIHPFEKHGYHRRAGKAKAYDKDSKD